uniref:Zinc finger piccolo-type domain-containing protein n=1 Tax=Mola mola TaxID=94237 RepID=A0A3Q3W1T9_MOLML
MGNEASLEGGEGPPSGLPEGLAPDGKGGFVRLPEMTPVNLSELSAEERNQLAAVMSRAPGGEQQLHEGRASHQLLTRSKTSNQPSKPWASRGQAGLSKSRTTDAFNQGPVGKPPPGRSPSSLSLFESRFRQEPKDPETKSSGMFGSSFLSGANPLSAVSSMTSSFGLFGDEEEGSSARPESKQGGKPPGKGPQQGQGPKGTPQGAPQKQGPSPPGQGPKQGQGPPGQGPRQGQGPPGQGPKSGQGPSGQGPPGQGPRQGQGPPGQGLKSSQGPSGQGPPGQCPRQGQGPPGQGPKAAQGPAGQGPPGQGPRPGQGPPGHGAKQGGLPQQKSGPAQQGPEKPGPKQQGPPGPESQPRQPAKSGGPPSQQGAGKPGGGLCPLCKTTHSADTPNYSLCTECKKQVCNLSCCAFITLHIPLIYAFCHI